MKGLIKGLKRAAEVTDKRKPGNRLTCGMPDIALSAFAVFYFQHPSLPHFQQAIERKRHQNNPRTLFGVEKIQ